MRVSVGFQGFQGAFSDQAARTLVPDAATIGFPSFDELLASLDAGRIDYAVLPVENAIAGAIPHAYDLLWSYETLHVVDEIHQPVAMSLVGVRGATIDRIREVRTHPVALDQVHRFLEGHPHWKRTAHADTAGAIAEVVDEGDPTVAAIGPALAAELYGAAVLQNDIQDDRDNSTRMFLLAHGDRRGAARPQRGRACVGLRIRHRPGSLAAALDVFARHEIDLRHLLARPDHVDPFHYRFYLDLADLGDARLEDVLAEIDGTHRIFGRY